MSSGPDFSRAVWRKSSRSNGTGGNCVEVARLGPVAGVRDSKNPAGPVLVFRPGALSALVASL